MSEQGPQQSVLAMDTSMAGVSVGVVATNGHVVSRMVETQRGQAAILVPMIQEVIAEAQITFQDLDLIACTVGPGSFTGIRIGLSTARTLGLTLDIPVVGLCTLDVMRAHYKTPCDLLDRHAGKPEGKAGGLNKTDKPLLIVLETKRQDFYARYYDASGMAISEPMAADASVVLERAPKEPFLVGGDCLKRFQGCVSGDFELLDSLTQPDPILIAQMGLEQFEEEGDQGAPQPLYLRGADVSQPKHPPRKLEQV